MAKDKGSPAPLDADSRIAPDPFAAVLPAIAALGAIASIASINWAGRERTLKFGVHGPRVSTDAARLYQQAINDVASMLVLASQNSFEVMCAIEDGTVEAPEEIFFGFGECQDRLNKLIQNRATLKASVDTGAEVAERLAQLVRELKKYRHD